MSCPKGNVCNYQDALEALAQQFSWKKNKTNQKKRQTFPGALGLLVLPAFLWLK